MGTLEAALVSWEALEVCWVWTGFLDAKAQRSLNIITILITAIQIVTIIVIAAQINLRKTI
jgi:hypothetical protein